MTQHRLPRSIRPLAAAVCVVALASLSACGGGGGGGCETCNDKTGAPVYAAVAGTVLDKQGQPVAGVAVSVFHHNTNTTVTTTTDAAGKYSVAGLDTLRNADYEIFVTKAGFGFYPSIVDAAGSVAKFDFNGLYRTLIRFLTMPARDVSGANFTALRSGDKMASLPRTGQTTSYASADDFATRQGVAWPTTRFTDNQNGTVTDHLTGLVWLKNAGCIAPGNWATSLAAANQLAQGACGLTDGSAVGQWRMPNVNELESLVDVAHSNPALATGHPFTNINLTSAYWSSTTYMALTSNAMAIRFSDGRWINGIDSNDGTFNNAKTSSNNAVWAVKSGGAGAVQVLATGVFAVPTGGGGAGQSFGPADDAILQLGAPLTSPRFIDKGDGTLADTVTGLTWLKNANCIQQPWAAALARINQLASGACGLSDGSSAGQWRMPNRTEMLSISDRAPTFPQAEYFTGQAQGSSGPVTGPVVFDRFVSSVYYWTSTTDAADPTQAWSIWSCDFGVYNIAKTEIKYALAVR